MSIHEQATISEVKAADFPAMLELHREVFFEQMITAGVPPDNAAAHVQDWGGPESLARVTQKWGEQLAAPDQYYLRVVRVGERLGGLFMATIAEPDFPGEGYIISIELTPALRGQGIGGQLIRDVLGWFGNRKANLHVLEGNAAAQRFYANHGFEGTDRWENLDLGGHRILAKLLSRKAGERS